MSAWYRPVSRWTAELGLPGNRTTTTPTPSAPARAVSSDPVHVGFRVFRHLIVDDVRNTVHVDSARDDIGGYEDLHATLVERAQCAHPVLLRLIRVDGLGRYALCLEPSADDFGAVLGAREHERSFGVVQPEQVKQQ